MSEVQIRRIQNLIDEEVDEIVEMLRRAYDNDTAVFAMTGGRRDLEDSLFRSMVRAGGLAGELNVIEDENGRILSMALWFPPGGTLFGTEEQRALGFNDFMSKLDDWTRNWWNVTYPQEAGDFLAIWLPMSEENCWYLSLIGTDPAYQRKGYATLLLNDAVKKVKPHNVIAFCSANEENANFYKKAGFPIRGYTEMTAKDHKLPLYGHSREVL